MSEELKPCPFCGGEATTTKKGPIRNQWWEVVCVSGECDTASITGDTEKAAIAAWNTRADLLPVVKPLVWEGSMFPSDPDILQSSECLGHEYHIGKAKDGWFFFDDTDQEEIGGLSDEKSAIAAADAYNATRIRACLDMIDPAELIRKAVNAKVTEIGNMVLRLAEDNDTSTQSGAQRFDALFHAVSRIHAMKEEG